MATPESCHEGVLQPRFNTIYKRIERVTSHRGGIGFLTQQNEPPVSHYLKP
jgi:hypothetical protein